MKDFLLVAVALLTGCTTQPISVAAHDSATSLAAPALVPVDLSVATSTLKLKTVPLPTPRNLDDKYVRLVLFVPTTSAGESGGNQQSLLKIASVNLLKFLWDRKHTLTVTAKPINLRSGAEVPTVQLFQAMSENDSPVSKDLEPMGISPYTTDVDASLTLNIQVARADTVDSGVASVAAQAFQLASDFASGGILSKFANKDFSAQAKKIDADIGRLLASGRVDPFLIAMNPFNTQEIDVSVVNGTNEQFLFSVKFDVQDTLIGRGATPLTYPTDPNDITKFKVAVAPIELTVRAGMATATSAINSASADINSFQAFCITAPGQLADLGLNRFDRAAVMYAYLLNSTWNRSVSVRPASDDDDQCIIATSDLVGKTNLRLNSRAQLERKATGNRSRWLEKVKQHLWVSALPAAIQTKKATDWEKVLADPVSISVTGKPFKLLSTDDPIEPGGGFTVSREEAASALAASDLVYFKRSFCFALDSSSKEGSFQTTCVQPSSGTTKSLRVEFTVDPAFTPSGDVTPTISAIRFINI